MASGAVRLRPARLAQRESASLTRKRSLVQSQYRARTAHDPLPSGELPVMVPRTISSAGQRFPDTEEVTGSIPVSSTHRKPPAHAAGGFFVRRSASAGEQHVAEA